MRIKRILSLILMVVMATMCFTGCSSNELNYFSIAREVSELTSFKIDGSVNLSIADTEIAKEMISDYFYEEDVNISDIKLDLAGEVSVDNKYMTLLPKLTVDDKLLFDGEVVMTEKGVFVDRELLISVVRLVCEYETVMSNEKLNLLEERLNKELGTYAYIQLTDFAEIDVEDVKIMNGMNEATKIFEGFFKELFSDFDSKLVSKDGNAYVITLTPENSLSLFKNLLSYVETNIDRIYDSVLTIIPTFKGTIVEEILITSGESEDVLSYVVNDLTENREEYILGVKQGILEITQSLLEEKEYIDYGLQVLKGTELKSSLEKKGNQYIEKESFVLNIEGQKVLSVTSDIAYTKIDIKAKDYSNLTYISIDDFGTIANRVQYKVNPVEYMEIQYYNYSDSASAELTRIEGTESSWFDYRIIDDRIYLPLRKICEYFGEDVYWDNEEHKAYIVRGEDKIDMTGTIIEDRTFIKMRDFEKLGYTLDWKDTGTGMYIVEIHKDINK